jgi:hypothetical protein
MQDFLEDIQKMNADSNFPQGNLKSGDLESLVGGSQKNKLAVHLSELRQKIKRGQASLVQMNQLMDTVRDRLNSLNERKRP